MYPRIIIWNDRLKDRSIKISFFSPFETRGTNRWASCRMKNHTAVRSPAPSFPPRPRLYVKLLFHLYSSIVAKILYTCVCTMEQVCEVHWRPTRRRKIEPRLPPPSKEPTNTNEQHDFPILMLRVYLLCLTGWTTLHCRHGLPTAVAASGGRRLHARQ